MEVPGLRKLNIHDSFIDCENNMVKRERELCYVATVELVTEWSGWRLISLLLELTSSTMDTLPRCLMKLATDLSSSSEM